MKSKVHEYQKSKFLHISKKYLQIITLFICILTLFSSCEVIGGIFKAGMGVGIFIVIAVIVLIVFIISKLTGKK